MKLDEVTRPKHRKMISKADMQQFLLAHCKLALGNAKRPIVRGFSAEVNRPFLIDTLAGSVRRSVNTSNHYTVILDAVLPPEFPRRSTSIICANFAALGYAGSYGKLFAIVPFDDAKIGICPKDDMFATSIKLFGYSDSIEDHNNNFKRADISDRSFEELLTDFKAYVDLTPSWWYHKARGLSMSEIRSGFRDAYTKPFVAAKPGDTILSSTTEHEVWVGGKAVAIPLAQYVRMMDIPVTDRLSHYMDD